uniref:C-type lectin domain-containing protein n=1 Tax=Oryzias latipes TaxID=8090 RepID=A0A3P9KUY7_ORYLA
MRLLIKNDLLHKDLTLSAASLRLVSFGLYLFISVYEGNRCPEGWRRFGSSCYYKSTEERDWHDSRDFCLDEGSDLVVVNSKEEQVGVFTLVPSSFLCLGFSTCMCAAVVWMLMDSNALPEITTLFMWEVQPKLKKIPAKNFQTNSA